MGYFDLPKGEVELLMGGAWKSVEFTDRPTKEEIADCVQRWSKHHTVEAARYNSHRYRDEIPVIVWRKASMNKREFQKVIGQIRKDGSNTGKPATYPKAMMTGQQEAKRTATVNCGGEWYSAEATQAIAEAVMQDPRFAALMEKYYATARIEPNPFGGVQIRINY